MRTDSVRAFTVSLRMPISESYSRSVKYSTATSLCKVSNTFW
jgi:hypothetical protein